MKEKIAGVNSTLLELLFGIFIYGIICQAVGSFFVQDRGAYSSGLWVGVVTAAVTAIHMWKSLDRALDYDENTASKKMRAQSVIRYACIVVIMGLTMISGFMNPLAAFLGIMGLKVAAYLQPFTHKFFIRFFYKKTEE